MTALSSCRKTSHSSKGKIQTSYTMHLHNLGPNAKLEKVPCNPDGYQVEHELATCPCSKEEQEHVLH